MKKTLIKLFAEFERHHFWLLLILVSIVIFRFPSLFEPFWYGDEGIFAAVARNLNLGGVLYDTAWDNKPPAIYLTYQLIFKLFGVSMYWLRLVALAVVLSTAVVIYEIAVKTLDKRRALAATSIFGLLTSLRLLEGNLALTEIFMILPISGAMLLGILRKFDLRSVLVAGFLFAVASLYKQVGGLEAAAFGIYLFLIEKNFSTFFKKGLILTCGFVIPYAATFFYFLPKGLVDDWIFGAYTYYQIYLEESPQYAIFINISKIAPVFGAIVYSLYLKYKVKKVEIYSLFFLWAAFSFLGSYFSGRTYGHYLIQATPAIALLLSTISFKKIDLTRARIAFSVGFFIPLLFLTRLLFSDFLSGGPINQLKYWGNFFDFASGRKSVDSYNDFFDSNVNTIMTLSDALETRGARGGSFYIWGDYPWLYAIADGKNPSRYVTSFHVFGVPGGKGEVAADLEANPPQYIIKPKSSIGYFEELEIILSKKYTLEANIDTAEIYSLSN